MLRLLVSLGLFGGLLAAGAAQAGMVDLTNGHWSANRDNPTTASRMFGSNRVTLSAIGGNLNFSQGYDGSTRSTCGSLACTSDGVGIGDDEISYGGERLTATFSSAVTLNSVQFLDLFAAEGEHAQMLVNFANGGLSKAFTFDAIAEGLAGYLAVDLDSPLADVLSIDFFTDKGKSSDFALAGLGVDWGDDDNPAGANNSSPNDFLQPASLIALLPPQSVPAPGLAWLMLAGLLTMIGVNATRRRQLPKVNC